MCIPVFTHSLLCKLPPHTLGYDQYDFLSQKRATLFMLLYAGGDKNKITENAAYIK